MLRAISITLLFVVCLGFTGQNQTTRLIEIRLRHHDEVYILNRQRLTIVDAGANFARALVNDEEVKALKDAGFDLAIVIDDYQVYKDEIFQRGFYHTYAELYAVLDSFATEYSNICRLDTIGFSVQDSAIWAMRVTDNPLIEETEPEIRLAGNMHGDEHIGTEITLFFLRHLLMNYPVDPHVQAMVDNNEIWILPTLNPDGKVRNTRSNANGVDLNRDYGYFWDGEGHSPAPSSQIENQILMQHLEENNISIEYNYHSWAQYVNYPWDYHQADPPDSQYITTLSEIYADSADLTAINGYDWYQVCGSLQDYTIGTNGTFAWTIETAEPSSSSSIDQICEENRNALMDICARSSWGITGIVKDSLTDSLLYARIEFITPERIDIYTDPVLGDFHKMIEPGTYTLRISANGYAPKIVDSVIVAPMTSVSVSDILLMPDSNYQHAFKVVITRFADHDILNNKTQPRHALGPADSIGFSLGQSGYIVLDMGVNSPITDSPGDDFTIFEADDGTDEGYEVYASNDWKDAWLSCGTATGTASFDLAAAGTIEARYLRIVDDGNYTTGQYAGFDLDAIHAGHPTGIAENQLLEKTCMLINFSVSPNPCRHGTVIRYQIPEVLAFDASVSVNLSLYDATGRLVRDLINDTQAPGQYVVNWDGKNNNSHELPAGIYFARMSTGVHEQYDKIILLR